MTRRKVAIAEPDVRALLREVLELRAAVHAAERELVRKWRPWLTRPAYRASAANLAAYVGLRRRDLRPVQRLLGSFGLTSLGNCEGHVKATLDAVAHVLGAVAGESACPERMVRTARQMVRSQTLLRRNTTSLFGPAPAPRWTRFMATLPSEAAREYGVVRELVRRGMDVARINCAHDGPAQWARMVRHVRRAQNEAGRPCRVLVDLSGPKLRVGPVQAEPAAIRLKARRDVHGGLLQPCHVVLDASRERPPETNGGGEKAARTPPVRLVVDREWLAHVRPGDRVRFQDLRGRERVLVAEKRLSAARVLARAERSAYVDGSTRLELESPRAGHAFSCVLGSAPPEPLEVRVGPGDVLLLTREPLPGEPKAVTRRGRVTRPAHIACSEPRIFAALRVGHRVWIDDGKVGTVVEAIDENGAWLRVTSARARGERLAAGKGMNFPDSNLPVPALGEADRSDLDFAVKHADMVGFSFVRSAADLDALVTELTARGRPDMGIVAKIETRAAVRDLPAIIVHGAGRVPFGIMIARGDLAVEIGYERMAEVQEEILSLCEAAHVPVIWATQVLENLVKQGRPSRAEVTDAAMAERAECVMLNKGPYVLQALEVLDGVVARMQAMRRKKTSQFGPRRW